jgi:glycosyltransferase involved in cell wall biosynthesis
MPHAFNFRILGHWKDGYLEKACKRFCTQNQLSVHFHNDISKEQKTLYLSNSDIFLFPPREPEGHPWVIIEAMAAGLPIITTDQGAITESVFHEQNGFIVQPSRPDQIVKYLIELYTNPKKCKAMGEYSYKLYKKHFTEEKMVEHLVNVFKDILDESPDKMPIKINPNHQKEWSKLRCNNSFKI